MNTPSKTKRDDLRLASRWIVTPLGKTHSTREEAVDEAARHAASEGMSFAVCRVEATAVAKVAIEWEA